MDILWAAAGIGAIVFLIFFALTQHWQRILRHQTFTIGRLNARVRDLQEMVDPEFRRRLNEESPLPLDQVFHFTFHFSEKFWREQLQVGKEEWECIRAHGSFVGSVKLERWRSHMVATVAEALPESSMARWQTRTLDFYPDAGKRDNFLTIWELRLAPANGTAERKPTLELNLRSNSLELRERLPTTGAAQAGKWSEPQSGDRVFFSVPMDTALLAPFRSADPAEATGNGNREFAENAMPMTDSSWENFYTRRNEDLGIEWQLRLRDLSKKAQWERWKILDSPVITLDVDE